MGRLAVSCESIALLQLFQQLGRSACAYGAFTAVAVVGLFASIPNGSVIFRWITSCCASGGREGVANDAWPYLNPQTLNSLVAAAAVSILLPLLTLFLPSTATGRSCSAAFCKWLLVPVRQPAVALIWVAINLASLVIGMRGRNWRAQPYWLGSEMWRDRQLTPPWLAVYHIGVVTCWPGLWNFALVILPVVRVRNVVSLLAGGGCDEKLEDCIGCSHALCGFGAVLWFSVHGILTQAPMLAIAWQLWMQQMVPSASGWYTAGAVNFSGMLSWLALLALALTSLACWRRRWYRSFYLTHLTCVPLMLLTGVLHYQGTAHFVQAGCIAYIADVVARRWLKQRRVVAQLRLLQPGGQHAPAGGSTLGSCSSGNYDRVQVCVSKQKHDTFLQLDIPCSWEILSMAGTARGFFWLKVPAISEWQWHPFSLAAVIPWDLCPAAPCPRRKGQAVGARFLIKVHDGWTRALAGLVCSLPQGVTDVPLLVEGPYGEDLGLKLRCADAALLVAGGSGIAPLLAALQTLVSSYSSSCRYSLASPRMPAALHVLWVLPNSSSALLDAAAELLSAVAQLQLGPIVVHVTMPAVSAAADASRCGTGVKDAITTAAAAGAGTHSGGPSVMYGVKAHSSCITAESGLRTNAVLQNSKQHHVPVTSAQSFPKARSCTDHLQCDPSADAWGGQDKTPTVHCSGMRTALPLVLVIVAAIGYMGGYLLGAATFSVRRLPGRLMTCSAGSLWLGGCRVCDPGDSMEAGNSYGGHSSPEAASLRLAPCCSLMVCYYGYRAAPLVFAWVMAIASTALFSGMVSATGFVARALRQQLQHRRPLQRQCMHAPSVDPPSHLCLGTHTKSDQEILDEEDRAPLLASQASMASATPSCHAAADAAIFSSTSTAASVLPEHKRHSHTYASNVCANMLQVLQGPRPNMQCTLGAALDGLAHRSIDSIPTQNAARQPVLCSGVDGPRDEPTSDLGRLVADGDRWEAASPLGPHVCSAAHGHGHGHMGGAGSPDAYQQQHTSGSGRAGSVGPPRGKRLLVLACGPESLLVDVASAVRCARQRMHRAQLEQQLAGPSALDRHAWDVSISLLHGTF